MRLQIAADKWRDDWTNGPYDRHDTEIMFSLIAFIRIDEIGPLGDNNKCGQDSLKNPHQINYPDIVRRGCDPKTQDKKEKRYQVDPVSPPCIYQCTSEELSYSIAD